jgi:hypothetical protein
MPLALLATIALAAVPPPAISAAADDLVLRLGAPAADRRALALAVEADAPALAQPLETALAGALGRRGWAVAPVRGDPDPEARARQTGADWLLRVRGGLVPGRPEVALVGEAIPTWPSFFLQRRPGARPVPPRLVQARVAADPETLLLGRPPRPLDAGHLAIRKLARIPGRVLALAVGDPAGDGAATAILAVTPAEVLLLSPQGAVLARRALDPDLRRPIRAPAATAAIGEFGGGRLAYAVAGAPQGEVLALRGGRLEPAGAIAAAPLCAGAAGRLFGAFAPGKGALADVLSDAVPADARPRSGRELLAVAAAPRGGRIAFAVLGADFRLELLGPDLAPVAPPVEGVGAGFALADLDGNGTAEVVASAAAAGATDRIRVLAPLAPSPLAFESPPVEGTILAGAAGDLTGDGVDDALLAAIAPGEGGAPATDLLLITADPREVP